MPTSTICPGSASAKGESLPEPRESLVTTTTDGSARASSRSASEKTSWLGRPIGRPESSALAARAGGDGNARSSGSAPRRRSSASSSAIARSSSSGLGTRWCQRTSFSMKLTPRPFTVRARTALGRPGSKGTAAKTASSAAWSWPPTSLTA